MDSKAGPSRLQGRSVPSRSPSSHSESESSNYHTDEDEDGLREDTAMYDHAHNVRNYMKASTKGKNRAPPTIETTSSTRSPADTVSNRSTSQRTSRSWTDLNMSIAVALLSPIGNWLTGSDHVKHLCLLLLLIFYLHQLIEVPWQLYHQSRTRPSTARKLQKVVHEVNDASHHAAELALSELRSLELFYLGLSVFAPFLGSHLIRAIFTAMEVDSLSWFSQTLFVLATGVRPWSHLIQRLQQRTSDLQDAADKPMNEERHRTVDDALATLSSRLESLENILDDMRAETADIRPTKEACEEISDAVDDLERFVHRHERKAELARISHNSRLAMLETGLQRLEDRSRQRDIIHDQTMARASSSHMPSTSPLSGIIPEPLVYAMGYLQSISKAVLAYFPFDLFRGRSQLMTNYSSPSSSPEPPSVPLVNPLVSASKPTLLHMPAASMPCFNGTPLETIPEDSDSEDTYVSESLPLSPRSAAVKLKAMDRSRSRSRSLSGARNLPETSSLSAQYYSTQAIEFAATVASWPYRVATSVFGKMVPPA